MIRCRLLAICLVICLGLNTHCLAKTILPEAELDKLDATLANADLYQQVRRDRIDSLRSLAESKRIRPERKWQLLTLLGDEYRTMNADSSLVYYNAAHAVGSKISPDSLALLSRISSVGALAGAGLFSHAENEYNSLLGMELNRDMSNELLLKGRMLYSYLYYYVGAESELGQQYLRKYQQCDSALMRVLPKSDMMRQFIEAEHLISLGRNGTARQYLASIMHRVPEESNLYGMAAYQMATTYLNEGDTYNYCLYLAKAANSDALGGIHEGLALPTLADWLYRQGELDRASQYINQSMKSASGGNARMRAAALAKLMPAIDAAYKSQIASVNSKLIVTLVLTGILLVISALLVLFLLRMIRKGRVARKKLAATGKIQESYIGHFIGLCLTYSDRLESMNKMVERKLSSGQHDDLLRVVRSGKFAELKADEFFSVFDRAILDLYPDFIGEINLLLKPEEQLSMPAEGVLTPELRIYALVRLGVNESSRIAGILRYSPNTVYAYRNRMRNRAINRETFDADILTKNDHSEVL